MAMAFRSAVILFSFFPFSSPAIHSLKYEFIATSGIPAFPQFLIQGYVNDMIIFHYDSETKRAEPRQEWMEDSLPADYWDTETKKAHDAEQIFRKNIEILKRRFNKTGGEHTVNYMYGCQWDDESGETVGFKQHVYDGEDFLSLDVSNRRWISLVPQAIPTAQKWNRVTPELEKQTNYLTQSCTNWLKKYVQYGNNTLRRTVPPNVSVFETQGTGHVCHAAGFYPEGVMITWKKDGEKIVEGVSVGETLPNEDGTFQKRVVLTLSPEELQGSGVTGRGYTCEVEHRSGFQTVPYLASSTSSLLTGPVGFGITAIFLLGVFLFVKRKLSRCQNSDADMVSLSSVHSKSPAPSVSSQDLVSSDPPLIDVENIPPAPARRTAQPQAKQHPLSWKSENDADITPPPLRFLPAREPGVHLRAEDNHTPLGLFELFFSEDAKMPRREPQPMTNCLVSKPPLSLQ